MSTGNAGNITMRVATWCAPFTVATSVATAMATQYPDHANSRPSRAVGILVTAGAGNVVLKDVQGVDTPTIPMSADGSAGPAALEFAFDEIVSLSGISAGRIFA